MNSRENNVSVEMDRNRAVEEYVRLTRNSERIGSKLRMEAALMSDIELENHLKRESGDTYLIVERM